MERGRRWLASVAILIATLVPVSAFADPETIQRMVQRLREIKETTGMAPTDDEYTQIHVEIGSELRKYEWRTTWKEFGDLQEPSISKADLAEIILAKRESIQDLQSDYQLQRQDLGPSGAIVGKAEEQSRLTVSGNRIRADIKRGPRPSDQIIKTYDGQVVRQVFSPTKDPSASITGFKSRAQFFEPENVLANSMLADAQADFGAKHAYAYDIYGLLQSDASVILQKTSKVNGAECIVVTDGIFRVFLDPQYEYSVTRYEEYHTLFDDETNTKYRGRKLAVTRESANLTDVGNGIWLPKNVTMTWYTDGKPTSVVTTNYEETKINEGVDEAKFVDVIPRGAVVSDGILNVVYFQGEDPSIERTISQAVPNASTKTRWLFVAANVLGAATLWVVYVQHRKRRIASKGDAT